MRRRIDSDRHRVGVSADEADIELIESRRRWNAAARASRHFDMVLIKQRTSRAEKRDSRRSDSYVYVFDGRQVYGGQMRISGGGKDWQVEAGWLRTTMVRLTRLKNVAWSIKGNDRSWHAKFIDCRWQKDDDLVAYNVARKRRLNVRRV